MEANTLVKKFTLADELDTTRVNIRRTGQSACVKKLGDYREYRNEGVI